MGEKKYAGPILAFFPFWWRFLQCLRRFRDTKAKSNLVNAGKYCSAFFVILFSTLHASLSTQSWDVYRYLWIISVIVSSMWGFVWDVKMDWGLFHSSQLQWRSSKNFLLREQLLFPYKWVSLALVFHIFFSSELTTNNCKNNNNNNNNNIKDVLHFCLHQLNPEICLGRNTFFRDLQDAAI